MYSAETIRDINSAQGDLAKEGGLEPVRLDSIENFGDLRILHLGDACEEVDKDYERVDTLFCDMTGMGSPGEPALTQDQLKVKLGELIEEHGPLLLALDEVGQFQGHLAVWKETLHG